MDGIRKTALSLKKRWKDRIKGILRYWRDRLKCNGADCKILTIGRSRGMALATCNIQDCEGMGIDIFDAWENA